MVWAVYSQLTIFWNVHKRDNRLRENPIKTNGDNTAASIIMPVWILLQCNEDGTSSWKQSNYAMFHKLV